MKEPVTDKDVISLFKEGATETPSSELDKRILDYAKSGNEKHNLNLSLNLNRWWPYLGLAASIGFIAILQPWQWDEAKIESFPPSEAELTPQYKMPAPAVKQEREEMMKSASEPAQKRSLMRAMPDDVADTFSVMEAELTKQPAPENKANVFAEVEALLAQGEKEKAVALLEQILADKPELASELPEKLKGLLK